MWAIVRRYGPRAARPYRIRIKSKPEHAVILFTFFAIGVTGFGAEAFRIALEDNPDYEQWSIIGYPLAQLVDGSDSLSGWHQGWWYAHVLSFVLFLVILPVTMLRHIFTSPLNMYLSDKERPKGAMKPMPNLMETELESFGASTIEDFTWKQLLDTDACTMCGRCTSVCPAHATGKPLDPREIVLKTGEVMAATGSPVTTPPIGVDPEITIPANWMFDRVTNEELWACTTCKACDEICPVNIEILDKILDMRRYMSLMESDFPTELGNAYRAMENSGNPWGISQSERADWAKDLDGVEVLDGGDPFASEYLYWVGCAGSFDDKNKKVTQAMAKLLRRAGIDVSILGPAENCTGDPARRSGNEYIFQMLAMQNIETLDGMGVRKIITQCPHCFNTLGQRVPPARRQLRGHPPQPVARAAHRRRPPRHDRRHPRRAHRLPRLVLPRSPQRRVPGAAQGHRQPRRASTSSRRRATAPRACAAAPAAPACGWRRPSARRSTTSGPGNSSRPAPAGSRRPAPSATS